MAEAQPRRVWRGFARAVPALGLLALAIHLALPTGEGGRAAWDALASSFTAPPSAIAGWVGAGLAVFGATLAMAALRFHVLLQAAGVDASLAQTGRMLLVAHFFNTVLPGGVVGDVWRVHDGHGRTRRGPAVLGVVAVERVLGLQALGVVAVLAVPFAARDVLGADLFVPVASAAAICAFAPLGLLWPPVARGLRRLTEAGTSRMPSGARWQRLARVVGETADGLALLRRDRGRLLFAVAASLVCQGLPVVGVWALAQPLEGFVEGPWFAVIVPVVTLASMLPISLGGAGVREMLFVTLFGRVGLSAPAALALGLVVGLVNLAWAAAGGALFALARSGPGQTADPQSWNP